MESIIPVTEPIRRPFIADFPPERFPVRTYICPGREGPEPYMPQTTRVILPGPAVPVLPIMQATYLQ